MNGTDRFDERDTIFSRMLLQSETDRYRHYYDRRPELEVRDAGLRNHPPGVFSDREPENTIINATFALTEKLRPLSGQGGPESAPTQHDGKRLLTPAGKNPVELELLYRAAEDLAESLGAVDFGVCTSDPAFFYSVRGRGRHYGNPVETILPTTIVLAFEMDREKTAAAPFITQTVEVARTYLDAARTALAVRELLLQAGFRAIAHIDGESELVMPPAAAAAAIGAMGRHGLIVHPKYGSRIRFSAVTTDAPLGKTSAASKHTASFNLVEYCEKCGACAKLCPKQAIPDGPADRKGPKLWQTDHEACYQGWKEFGTDCGVCLAVCPFSGCGNRQDKQAVPGEPGFLKQFMFGGGPFNQSGSEGGRPNTFLYAR